jgi:hypothetical protein
MLEVNELIALINNLDDPTLIEFFDVDVSGLNKFVKPETDLLSLIMLSKARNQGLDTVFVDEEKFFNRSYHRISGDLLDGTGPFDGAWYIEFELSPVLLHGKSFSLIDHSESMGYGAMIDTANLINELVDHYVKGTGKYDYVDWQGKGVVTVQQLADYINKILTSPETNETDPVSKSLRRHGSNLLWTLIFYIGTVFYYAIKPFIWLYRNIKRWLNKPL